MKIKNIVSGIFLALLIPCSLAFSTDLGTGNNKETTFKNNDKVAINELNFKSSAPLEDIIGNVKQGQTNSWVKFNPGNAEATSGSVAFNINSMETGIKRRDEHLKDEDWLYGEKFPQISFDLKSLTNVQIKSKDSQTGKITFSAKAIGSFNMRGKSKKLEVPVLLSYIKETAQTQKRAPGDFLFVEGSFEISLADFDIKGTKGLVGSKVGKTINMDFKLFYNNK